MQYPSTGGIWGLALTAGLLVAAAVYAHEQGAPPPPVDAPDQGAEAGTAPEAEAQNEAPEEEARGERKEDRLDRIDEESQGLWRDQMEGEAVRDFRSLDVDRDGRLSRNEVRGDTTLHPLFDSLDLNGDDFLSQEEYRAGAAGAAHRDAPDDPS